MIPFRAEHLLAIASRNPFDDGLLADAFRKEAKGPAFTAIAEDKPIAAAGVVVLWPGVGEAWTVFGHDMPKHALWITRTIRMALRDIIRGCNLHRVEATVLESQTKYRKWIELFGFEPESVAREYTARRENVVRYEWLRYSSRVRPLRAAEKANFIELAEACGYILYAEHDWFINGYILVACEDEKLVGYAVHSYFQDANGMTAYGMNMAIHPEYRGRGLGEKLHRSRLEWARRDGADQFVGHLDRPNPALERIFRKYGARNPVESSLGTLYITNLRKA